MTHILYRRLDLKCELPASELELPWQSQRGDEQLQHPPRRDAGGTPQFAGLPETASCKLRNWNCRVSVIMDKWNTHLDSKRDSSISWVTISKNVHLILLNAFNTFNKNPFYRQTYINSGWSFMYPYLLFSIKIYMYSSTRITFSIAFIRLFLLECW